MEKEKINMLEEMLNYRRMGWSVIPIIGGGKEPCIAWKEFQNRQATEEEIKEWFNQFPNAQIGIVTGSISNLIVVDIDKKSGGFESAKKLSLSPTLTATTGGGGAHYYYNYNEAIKCKTNYKKGIDIRANGGYVVAPPSMHNSGKRYYWTLGFDKDAIVDPPEWLVESFNKQNLKNDWKEVSKGLTEGERNNGAAIFFGKLLNAFEPKDWDTMVWASGLAWNKTNKPPMDEKELKSVFDSIKKSEFLKRNNMIENKRIEDVGNPKQTMDILSWRKIIHENFPDLLFHAEILLSVICQLLINDITNPFAIVLTGMPSTGKTIVLNFFAGIHGITYVTDNFSPASFVSQSCNVKKEDFYKVDLLPRIKNRILIARDLATIFSKKDDYLRENLGIMTRLLDGEGLSVDGGVHGRRGYEGDFLFMFIGASTPIRPRVWEIMGSLGSRIFFFNLETRKKTSDELAKQVNSIAYKQKELVCRQATQDLLFSLWKKYSNGVDWDKTKQNINFMIAIAEHAKLLASLRAYVEVRASNYADGGFEYSQPIMEQPDRINQLLFNQARGHAVACGKDTFGCDDVSLACDLALVSAPKNRVDLVRVLFDNEYILSTTQVENILGWSKPTARKEMFTLCVLGICKEINLEGKIGRPEKLITLSEDFAWFKSNDYLKLKHNLSTTLLTN